MAIPKNISNEHIEKAIEEIKQSKIPLERMSYTYYLKILWPDFFQAEINATEEN